MAPVAIAVPTAIGRCRSLRRTKRWAVGEKSAASPALSELAGNSVSSQGRDGAADADKKRRKQGEARKPRDFSLSAQLHRRAAVGPPQEDDHRGYQRERVDEVSRDPDCPGLRGVVRDVLEQDEARANERLGGHEEQLDARRLPNPMPLRVGEPGGDHHAEREDAR